VAINQAATRKKHYWVNDMTDINRILSIFSKAKADRQTLESRWRECFEYTDPIRGMGFVNSNQVPQSASDLISGTTTKKSKIYDNTAIDSMRHLVSTILGGIAPSSQRWLDLDLSDDPEFRHPWLDEVADAIWGEIHKGNFDSVMFDALLTLVTIGWCVPYIYYDEGVYFNEWGASQCYLSSSKDGGLVDSIFREYSLTGDQAILEFGDELPHDTKKMCLEGKHIRVLHSIRPRELSQYKDDDTNTKKFAKNMKFESCHILLDGNKLLRESGYEEFPCAIPRWSSIAGTAYAVGAVHFALEDIKTLNAIAKMILDNADINIGGMWIASDDGVLNTSSITIGSRKVVIAASTDSLKPLQTPSNFNLGYQELQDLRAQVRKTLLVDNLQIPQNPQMTATEINVRMEMARQILAPIFGRFQSEFLQPVVYRVFGLLLRNGKLPPAPEEIKGKSLNIRYVSPLARTQRMSEVVGMDRFEADLLNQSQLKPDLLDLYDFDQAKREKSWLLGVRQSLLFKPEQVKKTREDRAKAQQKAQQNAQNQEMTAAAMPEVAKKMVQ